ncbi:MAG: SCP2 sterol-binding domain-containing protein [Myxococcota bacterium]
MASSPDGFLAEVVRAISERLADDALRGSLQLTFPLHGTIIVSGRRVGVACASDEAFQADAVLRTSEETMREILSRDETVVTRYMANELEIDGDMGVALMFSAFLQR